MERIYVIGWNDFPMAVTRNKDEVHSLKSRVLDYAQKTDKSALVWCYEVPDFTKNDGLYTGINDSFVNVVF